MNYLIIIPARKNSKRIKNKNVLKLGGKKLIEHTIEFAKKVADLEDICLSTDSTEIKNISKKHNIEPVGVFVDFELKKIKSYIKKLNLKLIQLHGNEDENYIKEIKVTNKIKVIKVIKIKNTKDIKKQKNYLSADYFLFDYKPDKKTSMPGGNAKKFNWKLLKNKKIIKKWFISGGINKNNIKDALNLKNPYGIDVSSGVEDSPGKKSNRKIINLINIIDNYEN